MPVHHVLKGLPSSNKQKSREEEEAHLIELFIKIKEFVELSATKFVCEKTGELSISDDDTELKYLPPSWLRLKLYQQYACMRGWDATPGAL